MRFLTDRCAGLMRLPDVPAATRIEIIEELIDQYGEALNDHAVVAMQSGRVRVSHSPRSAGSAAGVRADEGAGVPDGEELLRRSVAGEKELQRAMRELEQSVCGWQFCASGLEQERDEVRESAAANRQA